MPRNNSPEDDLQGYFFGPIMYPSLGTGHLSAWGTTTRLDRIEGMITGRARGLSPQFRIRRFECSICHENQEDCPHEPGVEYEGAACQSIARDIDFIETSIVPVPADPRTYVTDLLVVSERRRAFDWYGFESDSWNSRFKNIQTAFDKRVLPEKAALKFSSYFSMNDLGLVSYR